MVRTSFILALAAVGSLCWPGSSARVQDRAGADEDSVAVTFLANAGFLITGSAGAVLIDAFVEERYSMYGALDESAAAALKDGRAPFDRIVLALASHVHRDHFQSAPAIAFLDHSPHTTLASTPQVVESVLIPERPSAVAADQIYSIWPDSGSAVKTVGGVRVEFMPLRHTNEHNYGIENLGHLIQIGETRLLHIGDAEMLPEHYDRFELSKRDIDIAFIPYWFFLSRTGRSIVYDHISASRNVAMHIPPVEADEVTRQLVAFDSTLIIASSPGDSWSFR